MPAPLTFTRIGEQENVVVMGTGTWVWVPVFMAIFCYIPDGLVIHASNS